MNLKNIQHKIDKNILQINNLLNIKIQKQNILLEELRKLNIELQQILIEKDKAITALQKEISEKIVQQNRIMIEQNVLVRGNNIEIKEKIDNIEQKIENQNSLLENLIEEILKSEKSPAFVDLKNKVETLEQTIREIKGVCKEILWGEIFNNTVSNSNWLTDKSFSPGRWAVGYQYLYSVYRILNIAKPKTILELGLGQSTKLLSQYAKSDLEVEHIVVEHDQDWIDFYKRENELSENTKIIKLERITKEYKGDDSILAFKNFKESLQGLKFEFISIDAPLGGYGKVFSRIDLLEILPNCLNNDFVIVIDDYNRKGEKNTVNEIEQILKQNNIAYVKGIYYGEKQCIVICSDKFKFFCSM